MVRSSRLNVAEHCGFAGAFVDRRTTLPALFGDAFHAAIAARQRPYVTDFRLAREVAMAQLSAEERDEVSELVEQLAGQWTPPEDACFEQPIGLDRNGRFVPYGSPEAIIAGTADSCWVAPDEDGAPCVFVLDFKSGARASFNVPAPGNNLQVASYGFALADWLGASKMRLGIYLARDDKWLWDTVDLDSEAGTALWARVKAAACRDPSEMVVSADCADCYVRLSCPAHMLPACDLPTRDLALSPLREGFELVAPERLLGLLLACDAMKAAAEAGRDWAKAYVREHGPIVIDGKQWGPIVVKGREGTSVKLLKEAGLYDRAKAVGAVRVGAPTEQHRWTKRKDTDEL